MKRIAPIISEALQIHRSVLNISDCIFSSPRNPDEEMDEIGRNTQALYEADEKFWGSLKKLKLT